MSELPADTIFKTYTSHDLPRMVLPDLAWLGGCTDPRGSTLHSFDVNTPLAEINHGHCVSYVLLGRDKTLMIDPGHFGLWYTMENQLDQVLGDRPLDYVFVSHQEIPHTGNLGRVLDKYPNCVGIGDMRDYHLFHPEVEMSRLRHMRHGESVDLGDRKFTCLGAIWKDLTGTMYGYDDKLKLLYTPDNFEFSHSAMPIHCGKMMHEMADAEIDTLTDQAFGGPIYGGKFRDQHARVKAFRNLLARYPVEIITSGHYGPIMGKALRPAIEKTMAVIPTDKGWMF